MAHAYKLSEYAIDGLCHEIRQHLDYLSDARPPQARSVDSGETESVDLAETFDVWMLGAKKLAAGVKAGQDLAQLAKPTHHLHHQVKQSGAALCSATSSTKAALAPQVSGMALSPLAEKIDRAIDWLDHHSGLEDDPLVRLLVIPAYQVNAFWLVDEAGSESRVVVIDAPAQFKHLPLLKVMSSRKFIAALLKEKQIVGFYE